MGSSDLKELIAALGQVGEIVAAASKEILVGPARQKCNSSI